MKSETHTFLIQQQDFYNTCQYDYAVSPVAAPEPATLASLAVGGGIIVLALKPRCRA